MCRQHHHIIVAEVLFRKINYTNNYRQNVNISTFLYLNIPTYVIANHTFYARIYHIIL